MGKLIGRGQFTIVSLHNGKQMQLRLNSNMPAVQFFYKHKEKYSPDYTKENVVITPELQLQGFSGDQAANRIKNIKWKINGGNPSEYGGSVSSTAPYPLTISSNMTRGNQLYVTFACEVVDPDTHLSTPIHSDICFTKHLENESTPMLTITCPNGCVFKNDEYASLTAVGRVSVGALDKTASAKYTWFQLAGTEYVKFVDDEAISGQGTNTITIQNKYADGALSFKCIAEYKDGQYVDYVGFLTQRDPYIVEITTLNGDKMHNGKGEIVCEAHVFHGKSPVPDAEADKKFIYKWVKYNKQTGQADPKWSRPSSRIIKLHKEDIDRLSTFVCELYLQNGKMFPYYLPLNVK